MEKLIRYRIEKEWAGKTVSEYLKKAAGLTAAQIRSLKFKKRGILLNQEQVRVTAVLEEGDCLELGFEEKGRSEQLRMTDRELKVLYEDRDLICVRKPSGLVTHPCGVHYEDSLANDVYTYFRKKQEPAQIRCIGRLDKDTSGILVFAKNKIAAARLWKQKEEGIFRKEYLALCEGVFPEEACRSEQKIDLPIGPVTDERTGKAYRVCVSPEGKPAVTYYKVIRQKAETALVRLHLETGRMHQIRVHMAAIGHPLVKDPIYGRGRGRDEACLCAWKAELCQPFTGEKILVELPEDLQSLEIR